MIDFNKIKILKGYTKRLLLLILGVLGSLLEVIGLSSIEACLFSLERHRNCEKQSKFFHWFKFIKNFSNTDFLTAIIIAIFLLFLFKNF